MYELGDSSLIFADRIVTDVENAVAGEKKNGKRKKEKLPESKSHRPVIDQVSEAWKRFQVVFSHQKKKEVALFFLLVMADRNQLRRRLLQTQNIRFERSSSRTSTQFRSLMK